MPDDNTALTAKPIPGSLTIGSIQGPMNIAPRNMAEAIEFARVMSKAGVMLRETFRDNPGACLAVALQAWRCNADPFALASKAYMVNNQVAYESQAIHALVNSSPVMARRLRATYSGAGPTRQCKVIGWLRGEDDPFEYESPKVGDIKTKNSPLWQSDPDQQLFYFASRSWARRWVPEILLGIYTTDEIEGTIIDAQAEEIGAHAAALQPRETKRFEWAVHDHAGDRYEFGAPERAIEACRKVLITAAAIGPDALMTAWENNAGLMATLEEAEYGSDADALLRLFGELAPKDSPAPDQPEQKGETVSADGDNGPQPVSDRPLAGGLSAQDEPAQRSVAREDVLASAADRTPSASDAPAAASATAQQPQPGPSATPVAENATPAPAAIQSGERQDPFWDRDSLRIDPPTSPRTNKPDYKAWSALLLPRIRQAWSVPLLNELMQANEDLINDYASNFGSRARDELMGEFEDAKNRVGG